MMQGVGGAQDYPLSYPGKGLVIGFTPIESENQLIIALSLNFDQCIAALGKHQSHTVWVKIEEL